MLELSVLLQQHVADALEDDGVVCVVFLRFCLGLGELGASASVSPLQMFAIAHPLLYPFKIVFEIRFYTKFIILHLPRIRYVIEKIKRLPIFIILYRK